MVYAVVIQTLRTFDRCSGRQVRFRFQRRAGPGRSRPPPLAGLSARHQRGERVLQPRACAGSSSATSRRQPDDPGPNIPGQPIFTCFSHDIIVHETCHAIIDGMREYFLEPTNGDSLAFHEALADIIAMLQHFTFPEPLMDTIQRTGGRLYPTDLQPELSTDAEAGGSQRCDRGEPAVDLALQFGESLGTRRALRTAIAKEPKQR